MNIYIKILILVLILYVLLQVPLTISNNSKELYLASQNILQLETSGLNQFFNPSIIKNGTKLVYCCRKSTQTYKNLLRHILGFVYYDSYIFFYETDLHNKNLKIIEIPRIKNMYLEDPRIILYKNKYYVSCTLFKNRKDVYPTLLEFSEKYKFMKEIKYKGYKYENMINKNWCPFVKNNILYLHTDCFPNWRVYKIDLENKTNMILEVEEQVENFFDLKEDLFIRCSTSWKDFDKNNYLCAVHSKTKNFPKKTRTMFLLIDKNSLLPVKKTKIFYLDGNIIEFISGLEIVEDEILITCGIGDYKAVTKKVKRKDIIALFN